MKSIETAKAALPLALIMSIGMVPTAAASNKPQSFSCRMLLPRQEYFIGYNSIMIVPLKGENEQYYQIHFDKKHHEVDILQKEPNMPMTESEQFINFSDVTPHHEESVSFHDIGGVVMKFTGAWLYSTKGKGAMVIPQVCKLDPKYT